MPNNAAAAADNVANIATSVGHTGDNDDVAI